jgi:hypothetical protein
VSGVVTAESGKLGTPSLIAIQDLSAGIVVRVPDGLTAPSRGTAVLVTGPLADPYGQVEIRPAASGMRTIGPGTLPAPASVTAAQLGEGTEAELVVIAGTASSPARKSTSGDLAIDLVDSAGREFRVMADGSSDLRVADFSVGGQIRITGIVGQRASRKGVLDGYRVWVRARADVVSATGGGSTPPPIRESAITIRAALSKVDGTHVLIEGTVTVGVSLLDATRRRIVVQDTTAAVEVLLPGGTAAPTVGSVMRIAGSTAHAWGAPRVRAETASAVHASVPIIAVPRTTPLNQSDEWQLVRVAGVVTSIERFGDRWRAEIRLSGSADLRIPILGQAGAGIPSTRIGKGATLTVTGIVKRPYPTATDRRFAVLPRGNGDVVTAGTPRSALQGSTGRGVDRSDAAAPGEGVAADEATTPSRDVTPDTDLAALDDRVGAAVRVAGLVASLGTEGFDLDDGTALAHLVLRGDALVLLPHLQVGDALAATGRVERLDGRPVVIVAGAADLVRVGDLGQAIPFATAAATPTHVSPVAEGTGATAAALGGDPTTPFGVIAMAALSALSIAVTLLRRRRARERVRAAVTARLATLKPTGGERESA